MIVPEIPRLSSDIFRGGTEDGALDGHPAVRGVIVPRGEQSFDGQSEEHDPALLTIEIPPGHVLDSVEAGHRSDLEPDVLQLRPSAPQELHRGADRQIEAVDPAVERRERRTHDFAAPESAMPSVPRTTTWRGCGSTATTGHVRSLGGDVATRGAAPSARIDHAVQ